MAQNSKDAQKRASRAERRAAEAAAMKARAEQMEKERKQQTIIGAIVVAVLVILVAIGAFTVYHLSLIHIYDLFHTSTPTRNREPFPTHGPHDGRQTGVLKTP